MTRSRSIIADQVELNPLSAAALDVIATKAVAPARSGDRGAASSAGSEGAYDSVAAERLIADALRLDPALVPALLDAGAYAADRGDASTADRHLKRAGVPSSDPLRSTLSAVMRLPESSTSRNQPCPCGSGRKYKLCCLRNEPHPLAVRAPLVHARMWTWALRAPRRYIGDHLLGHMDPDFVDGDMVAIELATFEPDVVASYLMARGSFLRDDERALVEQWRGSRFAPYEVIEIAPGTSVTLRPMLGGESVIVPDRTMSTSVRRLDMVTCRILTDGERPRILVPPIGVPRLRRQELLAAFEGDDPHAVAGFFRAKGPPALHNRDGHDMDADESDRSAC